MPFVNTAPAAASWRRNRAKKRHFTVGGRIGREPGRWIWPARGSAQCPQGNRANAQAGPSAPAGTAQCAGAIRVLGTTPPFGAGQALELLEEMPDLLPIRDNEACHHHGNHRNENRLHRLDVPSRLCRLAVMSAKKTSSGEFAKWPSEPYDGVRLLKMNKAALTVVDRWESAQGMPPEISEILGAGAKLGHAEPGLDVALGGGRKPSRCDVFAKVEVENMLGGIAVFATDSGFGKTVRKWQKRRVGKGQERLSAVCRALEVRPEQTQDLRYKLMHRTAAVIRSLDRNAKVAGLIVQSFSQEEKGLKDFKAFCKLLGVEDEPGKRCWVTRPSGLRILLGWVDSQYP